ncbi:MAG: helix-turn-helix domain-containing protein [Leptolyngbyaceae cyanobacterium RU_5_1]|nr:helix-turn-helix domain-containing protein [Leptolyngbyaceae cyanobacterium RU_5_1]
MKDQTLQIGNQQAEMLTEIGAYLRYLRQDQGLSLENVAAKTLIPVRLLLAIEEGNLERLPEPVYVQGFIRRYADAMGADGTEIANAFPAELSPKYTKPSWKGRIEAQLRPLHLYVLYTLLVVGAVSGLSYALNRSSGQAARYAIPPQQTAGQPLAQAANEFYGPPSPTQAAATASSKTGQTPSPTPISNKPVRVSLTIKGQQSWLRIVVDGKTEFEGILSQGTQRAWVANKQVTIRAGDAGAVVVTHNEGTPKPIGDPGAVDEVTFDANSQANQKSLESSALAVSGLGLL